MDNDLKMRQSKETMLDSSKKDKLQKQMQKDIPFFVRNATVVRTQDPDAMISKNQTAIDHAR